MVWANFCSILLFSTGLMTRISKTSSRAYRMRSTRMDFCQLPVGKLCIAHLLGTEMNLTIPHIFVWYRDGCGCPIQFVFGVGMHGASSYSNEFTRGCLIGYVMHSSLSVCVTREGGIQLFWCHTEMSTVDLPMIGVWSPVGGILVERSCWKTTKARTLLTLNEIFSPEPGWSKNTANAAQDRSNVGIPMLTI